MSGICGYLLKTPADGDRMTPMFAWIRPYGSAAQDTWADGRVALGCALDHIPARVPMDTPVLREGNVTAVMDALLYNRDELAEALGQDISALSDERVTLLIYLRLGEKGLRLINGDFAGAVYDGERLVLLRDHMGIRPLFWYQDARLFAFATDLRALLALPGMDDRLNEAYLTLTLTGYITDESEVTDYAAIRAVPPAHTLTVAPDLSCRKAAYWRLNEKKIRFATEQEYIDRLRALVYDAIRRRLAVAEGTPVGAELSGGLDSTVIDVIIRKLGVDPVCCSWSPDPETQPLQPHDEREIIEQTCQAFGLRCHYAFPRPMTAEETIRQMRLNKDLPDMGNPFLRDSMAYFRAQGCRVVFSGWGGDEGVSHRGDPYEMWYHHEYGRYIRVFLRAARGRLRVPRAVKRMARNLTDDRRYFRARWNFFDANGLARPDHLQPGLTARGIPAAAIPETFAYDAVKQIETGANRIRTQAAAALGCRYGQRYVFPFLDHRVEDFAVSIPRYLYFEKRMYRYLYRAAFREEMVPALFTYPYKHDPGRMTRYQAQTEETDRELALYFCRHHHPRWDRYIDPDRLRDAVLRHPENVISDHIERCIRLDILSDGHNVTENV